MLRHVNRASTINNFSNILIIQCFLWIQIKVNNNYDKRETCVLYM